MQSTKVAYGKERARGKDGRFDMEKKWSSLSENRLSGYYSVCEHLSFSADLKWIVLVVVFVVSAAPFVVKSFLLLFHLVFVCFLVSACIDSLSFPLCLFTQPLPIPPLHS